MGLTTWTPELRQAETRASDAWCSANVAAQQPLSKHGHLLGGLQNPQDAVFAGTCTFGNQRQAIF